MFRFPLEGRSKTGIDFSASLFAYRPGRLRLIETNGYSGGQIDFDLLCDSGDKFGRLLAEISK